ncbi:zinc finger and BTB domain-containing protein ttk isoform X2 [Lycorma delicatula]|uniref:zinc finger and BTB domain-containing protein ttk isoform X2 n=1 Tax=Lycorma delicatula TaxID=130591 RepID=UPI003F51022C
MSLGSQRFCLRWNNHQSNLLSVFDQLLHDEAFVDVTLAVEGQFLRAHKMVLSACSPYFQTLFVGHPDKHPIVILKDVPYADMRSLLDFMYRGEVSVDQDRLTAFLKVAESLRIKGLTEVNEERCDLPSIASSLLSSSAPPPPPPPPPHLHRIHHLPQHKRSLPPMAANPLLGSALTAPKRKRGRPRKLSGSDQTNGNGSGNGQDQDQDEVSSQPNRTDSPVLHNAPELLEVNMGEMQHSPGGAGSGSSAQSHGKESQQDGNSVNADGNSTDDLIDDRPPDAATATIKAEQTTGGQQCEPTPSTSMHGGTGEGERYPSVTISSSTDLVCMKIKEEFTTATDVSNNCTTNNNNSNNDGNIQQQRLDDADECYEDMIACSPVSYGSDHDDRNVEDDVDDGDDEEDYDNDRNPSRRVINLSSNRSDTSLVIKQEKDYQRDSDFMDEDISQYEMDSFRSMMASYGTTTNIINTPTQIIPRISISSSSPSLSTTAGLIPSIGSGERLTRNRPIDKASVRRYCTHEADNVYRCNVCAKTYTHISNFCRHFLSAHHGVRQEIPCPVCFKLFTRKDNMMTHTKQVHRLALLRGSGVSMTSTTPGSHDSNITQEQLLIHPQLQHSSSNAGNTGQQQHSSNDSS